MNDETLNEPKAMGLFDISSADDKAFYHQFRIRMNGQNSFKRDKHRKNKREKAWSILNLNGVLENTKNDKKFILCCSGIEFYGNVILCNNYTQSDIEMSQYEQTFEYEHDFDENGIIHWIGCNYGKQPPTQWQNPSSNLLIAVERGRQSEKGSVDSVVGRTKVKECCFLDYFICDFGPIAIKANKYSMKVDEAFHDKVAVSEAEKNAMGRLQNTHSWTIQVSNNKTDWKVLKRHTNDASFGQNDTASFDLDSNEYFRYFKVENNTMLKELHCSGIEIYGRVKYNKIKHKLPSLRSGGNGAGCIHLISPKCVLNDCLISANGQNGINCGGGGSGGNVLIDCNLLRVNGKNTKISCEGGKGDNNGNVHIQNDGQNGKIRIFSKEIIADDAIEQYCSPQPFVL